MIGRREERRKLALEEIERRNNIKNKKEKKRRSQSKDRGLPRIEGKKAVRKLNLFLGKDHKNDLYGVNDHHDKEEMLRIAPWPGEEAVRPHLQHVAASLQLQVRDGRPRHHRGQTQQVRHAVLEPRHGTPQLRGKLPCERSQYRAKYGTQYRRFQDSSFSSFSDTPIMTQRPSIESTYTYLNRYGYACQNWSFYSGSVGSQELIDMYGDGDSVFNDDR